MARKTNIPGLDRVIHLLNEHGSLEVVADKLSTTKQSLHQYIRVRGYRLNTRKTYYLTKTN